MVLAIEKSIAEQRKRQARIKQSKLQCNAWNSSNRVGVEVAFRGKRYHTSSTATVGLSGYASVHLGGRWGCVELKECRVVT